MNYRDLQNISNLSQEILIEGANEEHNVLNRWPYTSPYLQESTELDEASVSWNTGKTKSGLSPEEKTTLKFIQHGLSDKPQDQKRAEQQALVHQNMTDAIKKTGKRKVDKVGPIASKRFKNAAIRKRGGNQPSVPIKTVSGLKDANKESQSKLNKEQVDLYDIILSHLLDEGYAETLEQAQVIMVNMSEDWRESIVEEVLDEAYVDYRKGKLSTGRSPKETVDSRLDRLKARATKQEGENPDTTPPARKKSRTMGPIKREMDAHTSLGGVLNKAISPGLGNRAGASPRVAYGEPNTDRHQMARFRRGEPSTKG